MGNIAIHVNSISKKYYIGRQQNKSQTFKEMLTDAIVSPFRKAEKLLRGQATGATGLDEIIWALKDVSFDVKHGEIIGIIGGNGAGKSTLLKILSRITEPSEGFAEIHGRVGSLLEVGTGFHPELTGRENIYLNGAMLGMRKSEINRKFDEIVAFSEVDKFIDTPVKHYSSGMYLRLAFAVAAHLEPEILFVDEVLAVGDTRFQKKCLNKMEDVGKEGRTVLFVSHNMISIGQLCNRVLLFENSSLLLDGISHKVINTYLKNGIITTGERTWTDLSQAPGREIVRLCAVRIKTVDGHIVDTIDIRHPINVEMEYDVLKPGYALLPNFQLYNEEGLHMFATHDLDPEWQQRPRPPGRYVSTVLIPGNLLNDGVVFVGAGLETVNPMIFQFYESEAASFHVVDNLGTDSARGYFSRNITGVIRPLLQWKTRFDPAGQPVMEIAKRQY